MSPVTGLHHITAIVGDPARNRSFFAEGLGQRLVKKTVNFDDPGAYHLYYGDRTGSAGTIMTVFAWPNGRAGAIGAGQASIIQYAVPRGSLPFWRERLPAHGATLVVEAETVFNDTRAVFADPDGLLLALVETDDVREPWLAGGMEPTQAVRGFHGVTLALNEAESTAAILQDVFGYAFAGEERIEAGRVLRYSKTGGTASIVDLHADPTLRIGSEGVGVVHHVAFSVPDSQAQQEVREALLAHGLQVTPQIDRQYFNAIYARTPGGVLFEVATEEPGFARDEPEETLGLSLKLPPQYEAHRTSIEAVLQPI